MVHRRSRFLTFGAFTGMLLLSVVVSAADWPQFRGANRDGIAREVGLLKSWPPSGPPELWRAPLGVGFSGVAVVGERLYTMDSRSEAEYVVCLDTLEGDEIWRTEVGPLLRESSGDGPRSTPTVADGMVWAIGSLGDVVGLRADDGSEIWSLSIPRIFSTPPQLFGFTMMPLIVGEDLILEIGAVERDAVVALDKKTGAVVWRVNQDGVMANTSPIHITGKGMDQLVFLNLPYLFSLSRQGKLLWSVAFAPEIPEKIAFPVFVEPDLVFVSASYGAGGLMIRMRPGPDSDRPVVVETAWKNREMRNNISTSVARNGLLCGFDNATLKCLDAISGDRLWAKRGGFGKGTLIWADGHLIVLTESGRLLLVEAVREGYREKGALQVISGRTWTTPALANGQLYIRGPEEVVALDLRLGNATSAERIAGDPSGRAADLPSASGASGALNVAAIVTRYQEARGSAALAGINTLRQSGHFIRAGEEFKFVVYNKRPDLYRYEVHRPDGRTSIEAYDGKVAWQVNIPIWRPGRTEIELAPLSEIPPARLPFLLENEADIDGPLSNYQEKGHDVRLVGTESLDDGTPVYQLKVTLASGHVQHFYLDQRDFKVVVKKSTYADTMAYQRNHERVWYFTSYREEAGVLIPVSWELENLPRLSLFEIDEVEVNVELSSELFAMPQH